MRATLFWISCNLFAIDIPQFLQHYNIQGEEVQLHYKSYSKYL